MKADAEHFVYRLYGAEWQTLYIGCSADVKQRLSTHACTQVWWDMVAHATVQGPFRRLEGLRREKSAIHCERPRFNVQHNPSPPPPLPSHWRVVAEHIAERLDMPYVYALRAVASGQLPDRIPTHDDLDAFIASMPRTDRGRRLYVAMTARLIDQRLRTLPMRAAA